ncbi:MULTISPECIES: hypothetical protein [Pectobacterium]|uniref:hypothetical protein n=1 Tax=Pectobacterium TaxID=122277 RepID=UPI00050758FF|nr:hypothetical protein [Pectobacterium odoriferum]KGA31143.1 hypothetical protein KS43_19580 [Pectobacterium odoriferum]
MDYRLSYKETLEYTDAMEYLINHFAEFPEFVPAGGPTKEISVPYYKSHRFVLTPEGKVVFGDCMVPGINAQEFNEYRQKVILCQTT